jgi:conjugative relaxase-like TrwC/TraI family protein
LDALFVSRQTFRFPARFSQDAILFPKTAMILRIHISRSGKEAIKYFCDNRSLENYYSADGQEFRGNWGGKGAELLGLKGAYTDHGFARLVNNLHPKTGKQLTPRMKSDRRAGFDINFNCPKSVSLLYAWTKDERIIWALRQAQLETLLEMQEKAATRDRSHGRRDGDRHTGVFVWAEVIHLTARPENGIPDPHLHSHVYVFNVTWDSVENRWKALTMFHAHKLADEFNTIVTHRLAENLRKIGVPLVETKKGFEVEGIGQEFRDKFSRRTKTIEQEAIRRGITDPVQKATLAALTRERKVKSLLISEMEPYWWGSLLPDEERALKRLETLLKRSRAVELSQQLAGDPTKGIPIGKNSVASRSLLGQKGADWVEGRVSANGQRISLNKATTPSLSTTPEREASGFERRAAALAIEHLFERKSVVQGEELLAAALDIFGINGKVTVAGVRMALAEAPLLRKELSGIPYFTTAEVWAEEQRIADACLFNKGRFEAINSFWTIRDEELTDEQKNAVRHVLNSRDFITGISGNPGVGKTRILQEIKRGVEGGCYKLLALTPWGVTAHEVLRKEGFENAETVAKLLVSEELQSAARGAVLLVDEAGLLSAREADRLIALAHELGARLVFVGDVAQHHAVERGQAFDHLINEGMMDVARVTKIQRQKGAYKQYVELVLGKELEDAFKLADGLGSLVEMPLEERRAALASDYVAAIKMGETVQVVAPTHAECDAMTEGIRAGLKAEGLLKPGVQWQVLKNLGWTDAQRSDPEQYRPGLVVQINGHVKGFSKGEQLEVIGKSGDMVRVRSVERMTTKIKALPLGLPKTFSVHERDTMEISAGDKIRFTANGRTEDRRRLQNGSLHVVDYIASDGNLVLENGLRVSPDFKHLGYSYAITSHSAQGKTVDRVFLAESAISFGAGDLTQFLVSTTRGSKGFKIYTHDKEWLLEVVSQTRERMMATELMAEPVVVPDYGREQISKELGMSGPEMEQRQAEVLRQVHQIEQEQELVMEM